ncbi:MAG: penicillin-binding protein activator [Pseudomonadota bacterium]
MTVALLIPRTAPSDGAARLGAAIEKAARLGHADLGDPLVRLRAYNTAGQPGAAADAARRALSEGAEIVLGPLFSESTRAVAEVLGPVGITLISFSTDTAVARPRVYISGYTPEAETRRILAYAGQQGRRFVSVFRPRTPYGDAAARGVSGTEANGRVRIVASGIYERSFKGIEAASEPFANSARDAGAEAVLLPAGGKELQAVASFLNYFQLDPESTKYLGLGQWNSRASFQEASLNGGWFPAPDPDAVQSFAGRYAAEYGAEPPVLASLGYTAMQIAGQLIAEARRAGQEDAFDHFTITRPEGFRGAFGPVRFKGNGVAEHALAILEVGPRQFIVRDPAPRSFGAGS